MPYEAAVENAATQELDQSPKAESDGEPQPDPLVVADPRAEAGVVIQDSSPLFRRGATATLREAGFRVFDGRKAARLDRDVRLIVVVCRLGTISGSAIEPIHHGTDEIVVAIVDDNSPSACATAISAGASSVLFSDAEAALLVGAVVAAVCGYTVMPLATAAVLLHPARGLVHRAVSGDELMWLELLADGCSVEALAETAGYSRRTMFRKLEELYQKMSVSGKLEALIAAAQSGLLPPVESSSFGVRVPSVESEGRS